MLRSRIAVQRKDWLLRENGFLRERRKRLRSAMTEEKGNDRGKDANRERQYAGA
jgi:hypothetical protein